MVARYGIAARDRNLASKFAVGGMVRPARHGPLRMSQGAPASVFGGWNMGIIVALQGGSPFGLVTQTNTANAFSPGAQRVNLLRDPALSGSSRTLDRWFNTDAVAAPAPFTFGNAARSFLIGPGLGNLDLSLLKNHRWAERYNVQFRFEAFNITNNANFQEPGRALGSAGFGLVNSARAARVLQFGLKFEF